MTNLILEQFDEFPPRGTKPLYGVEPVIESSSPSIRIGSRPPFFSVEQ